MPTPQLRRIYQLPSLTTPATQLAGAYLVWEVPLGPVPGGYKTYRGTAEELAAYLRGQGLLSSETAALISADPATGVLTYEAPRDLSGAEVQALGLGVTTSAGTTHTLLQNVTSVYDSQTGELVITLPGSTLPADVVSAHLYRPTASGQEQMLAADMYPFGGGNSLPTIDLLDLTTAQMDEVLALTYTDCDAAPGLVADGGVSPAWSRPGQFFDALVNGENRHYYCSRGTYDPAAPAGTTGQGPAWHYFQKLG